MTFRRHFSVLEEFKQYGLTQMLRPTENILTYYLEPIYRTSIFNMDMFMY